jgi:phosphoglycolate phosphatase
LLLIFDLDGTLIDSSLDIGISMNATLRHMNRPELDQRTINSYVGDGAGMLVKRALGENASPIEVDEALRFFIEYYRQHALEHTRFYPGIRELLDELRLAGHVLAVLTNKPVRISQDILTALGVSDYFFRVYGGNSLPEKKPHPMGIETLLSETATSPKQALMIGDSDVDIRTARNAGIQVCGVTWGLKPESLCDPAPDFLVSEAHELYQHIATIDVGTSHAERSQSAGDGNRIFS